MPLAVVVAGLQQQQVKIRQIYGHREARPINPSAFMATAPLTTPTSLPLLVVPVVAADATEGRLEREGKQPTVMGRTPCCDSKGIKKGPWAPEEDKLLVDFVQANGPGNWRMLPKLAGTCSALIQPLELYWCLCVISLG